jgi:hypothetical protein
MSKLKNDSRIALQEMWIMWMLKRKMESPLLNGTMTVIWKTTRVAKSFNMKSGETYSFIVAGESNLTSELKNHWSKERLRLLHA